MRGLVGCLTTNAESAGFLHNAEVLTLCTSFNLTNNTFLIFSTVFNFSSPISLFLLPFMNHLPFSHLLLISHSNISSHLLLPPSLAILLVSVSLSHLRLVLPHVLPLLLYFILCALSFRFPTSPLIFIFLSFLCFSFGHFHFYCLP